MKKLLIALVLLLLPSLSWGWDAWNPGPCPYESPLSTQMRIYHDRQQQQRRDAEAIGNTLGQIWAQHMQRKVERDAMEFFKDGVTPEKIREFSRRYPNVPLAWIYETAAAIQSVQDTYPQKRIQSEIPAKREITPDDWQKLTEELKGFSKWTNEQTQGMSPQERNEFFGRLQEKWNRMVDEHYGIGK